MKTFSREELIEICQDAVVSHREWNNRDSYSAQLMIESIYRGLTAGLNFTIDDSTDEDTIWITFTENDRNKLKNAECLSISNREDYFRDCDPERENEMFDGEGISFTNTSRNGGYMPTRKRLIKTKGNDWY